MKNVTITEISGDDVDFDQDIDTDTVTATAGGVAVNGSVEQSVINTGRNSGILAGDDVDLEDSVVGNGNTQFNDSTVGAFSGRGNATNITGQNVNTGSGDLIDVDAEGDAQVANGNGNRFQGDVDVDLDEVDGPVNLAFGDGNRQSALEDNSTDIRDSFNTDNSVNDSFNERFQDSFNTHLEDNDSSLTEVRDSFNSSIEDNDSSRWDWDERSESHTSIEDNDTFSQHIETHDSDDDSWGEQDQA